MIDFHQHICRRRIFITNISDVLFCRISDSEKCESGFRRIQLRLDWDDRIESAA